MTLSVPDITPAAMQKVKDTKFTEWCGTHRMLRVRGDMFLDWAVPNTWSMHTSLKVLPTTWSWISASIDRERSLQIDRQ